MEMLQLICQAGKVEIKSNKKGLDPCSNGELRERAQVLSGRSNRRKAGTGTGSVGEFVFQGP